MTAKPHDALFKAAFESPKHAAGLFRALLPPSIEAAISWATLTQEPGSYIDEQLGDRHSDLLFSGRLRDRPIYLYLLLEHQSSNDADMPLRMLLYLSRIWERHRKQHAGPLPLIIPVVVSHAPGGWTAPVSFHQLFDPSPRSIPELAPLVPAFTLALEDLSSFGNAELERLALAAFPKLALWMLRDARDTPALLQHLGYWADTFREALRAPNGIGMVAQLLRYVALVGGQVRFEEFRANIHRQLPEAEEMTMTIAEELREEGRDWGRAEGRRTGLVDALVAQLTVKFGELSPGELAHLERADETRLHTYLQRILTAATIDAVLVD